MLSEQTLKPNKENNKQTKNIHTDSKSITEIKLADLIPKCNIDTKGV